MALDFGGSSGDDVDVGNDTSLQITGAAIYMCWVNFNTGLQNIDIISKQTSGARGLSLQTDDDPPEDMWGTFYIAKNASQTINSGWTTIPLVPGTWYHIAGQFIPSTAVQIWLNGTLHNEKTKGVPATMHDPANNLTIGGRPDNNGNADVIIDDVRIYNRNLSSEEMLTTYHGGLILDGLVSWWGMDERESGITASGADSVKDLGPSGNHGTPAGSVVYAVSEIGY